MKMKTLFVAVPLMVPLAAPARADAVFDKWPWQDTVFFAPSAPRAPVSARWHYPVKTFFECYWLFSADQQIAATDRYAMGPACFTRGDWMATSAGDKCGQVLHEWTWGLDGKDYDKRGAVRMHICAQQDEEGGDWTVLDGYSDRPSAARAPWER